MKRVIIVDDHPIVRKGLKEILTDNESTFIVDEASNGQEALDKIYAEPYDAVILDISMPGFSGLDVLKQVKKTKKGIPVLVLSRYPEDQYAVRVIKAGADGYLTKESAPLELTKAIRKVISGRKYISASLADQLVTYIKENSEKKPHEKLSDREFQVMHMLASGNTVGEIAEAMMLSVNTISTYRMRVLEKMNMNNNAQIMLYALSEKLIDASDLEKS